MHVLSAVMLLTAASGVASSGQGRVESTACGVSALVTHVFDGDTVHVAGVGRVRLLGIDAPELGRGFERPAPFAVEARERLQALVLRHWVRLQCDGPTLDSYSRHLAYLFAGGGQLINAQLVREGLARVSTRSRLQYGDELRRAEDEAQTRRRGMWGERPRIPTPAYRLPRAELK